MVWGLETCLGSTLPPDRLSEIQGLAFFFFQSLPFAAEVSHRGGGDGSALQPDSRPKYRVLKPVGFSCLVFLFLLGNF